MRKEDVQEALNRSLSGLQEDPWLAQRVMALEKGEKSMKKKSVLSLAMVAVMLLSFTLVAFAATEVYRTITINRNGEIVAEEDVEAQPVLTPTPKPVTDEEMVRTRIQEYLSAAPEKQYVYADGNAEMPKVTVFTEAEFNVSLDGCGYLTRPAFIPEGYNFEVATIFFGCDAAGEYMTEEFVQEDNGVYFVRYSISEGSEIITGYDVTYRNEEGQYISIYDTLSEYTQDDEYLFSFPEEYSYRTNTVPGMANSVAVSGNGWNQLNMMKELTTPIACRWYPEITCEMSDCITYQSEEIDVSSNAVDTCVLASMYEKQK